MIMIQSPAKVNVFLRLIGKLTSFLLPAIILLTGCGEAFKAEKILQKDKYRVAEQLLQAEYAGQISAIKDVLVYSPEKNIVYLILQNGITEPERAIRCNDVVSVSRRYNVRRLAFRLLSASPGKVSVSENSSIVSTMTLSYIVEEVNAEYCGIPVAGVYRGAGQDEAVFLAGLEAALPPKELDYSSIIHKESLPERRLISRTYKVVCRSGKWYPAEETSAQIRGSSVAVFNDRDHSKRLKEYFDAKNIEQVHDCWVFRNDVPDFRKLKAGYRLENGQWVCRTWDEYRKTRNAEVRVKALKQLNYLDKEEAWKLFLVFKALLADEVYPLVEDSDTEELQKLQKELGKITDIPEPVAVEIEQIRKAMQLLIKYPDCGKSMQEYFAGISQEHRENLEACFQNVEDPADRKALDILLKEFTRKYCIFLFRKEPCDRDGIGKLVKESDEWPFLRDQHIPELVFMRFLCGRQMSWQDVGILLEYSGEYPEKYHPGQIIPAVENVISAKISDTEKRCLRNIQNYGSFQKLLKKIQSLPQIPGFNRKRLSDLCARKLNALRLEYEISVVVPKSSIGEEFAEKWRKLRAVMAGDKTSLQRFYRLDDAAVLSASCQNCRGTGKTGIPCRLCHGTGICQQCKGRGVFRTYVFSSSGGKTPELTSKSCPVHCRLCGGRKMHCSKCMGHGFVPDYGKIKETMDTYSNFFHEEFLKIRKQKEAPEKIPEKTPEKVPEGGWKKSWRWFRENIIGM